MNRIALGRAAAFAILALAFAAAHATPDSEGLSRDVDSCVDFYGYVNRQWMQETRIPPDRATWGAFAEQIRRAACFLATAELAPGARAAIYAPNSVE